MDLAFSDAENSFCLEVRSFLEQKLSPRLSGKVKLGKRLTKEDMLEWYALLNEQGWLAVNWPKEHGGTGWSGSKTYF